MLLLGFSSELILDFPQQTQEVRCWRIKKDFSFVYERNKSAKVVKLAEAEAKASCECVKPSAVKFSRCGLTFTCFSTFSQTDTFTWKRHIPYRSVLKTNETFQIVI